MAARSKVTAVRNEVLDKFEEVVDYFADVSAEYLTMQIESEGRFSNSKWPDLSSATLVIRSSEGILSDIIGYRTGSMLRSLVVEKQGRFKIKIYFKIPKVQLDTFEMGAVIKITPKMVKWLAYHGVYISTSKERIYVPARPIYEPVVPLIETALNRKLAELKIPVRAKVRVT